MIARGSTKQNQLAKLACLTSFCVDFVALQPQYFRTKIDNLDSFPSRDAKTFQKN